MGHASLALQVLVRVLACAVRVLMQAAGYSCANCVGHCSDLTEHTSRSVELSQAPSPCRAFFAVRDEEKREEFVVNASASQPA